MAATTNQPLEACLSRLAHDDACRRQLQATALAYISDRVEGVPRKLLQDVVKSTIADKSCDSKSFSGEYERTPLLIGVLHEALDHATAKGLGATDACELVQVLVNLLQTMIASSSSGSNNQSPIYERMITYFVFLLSSPSECGFPAPQRRHKMY